MYFKQYIFHIDFMGDELSLGSENNDRRNTSLMITPRMWDFYNDFFLTKYDT